MRALLLILPLAACDAGHLGNPLSLPTRAIGSALENGAYNARRARVSDHLATHQTAQPSTLWDIAKTPEANRSKVLAEVATLDPKRPDWVEAATVIVMVHS